MICLRNINAIQNFGWNDLIETVLNRITLSGLIFARKNVRDFREFDLFHENETSKSGLNSSRMNKIDLKMQKKE